MSVYIIAEAGVNHNGSVELALQLIDKAVEAGADAVKFQTFKAEEIIADTAPKAPYQKRLTGEDESQLEMVKRLELTAADHITLHAHCKNNNIDFLSTAFDPESLKMLSENFEMPMFKIPSGEITNAQLLLETAKLKKPIILSTGMCILGEIEDALGVIAFGFSTTTGVPSGSEFKKAWLSQQGYNAIKDKVTLLHCTTEYPAPFESVNLAAMDGLKKSFGLRIGLSDHTVGINIPIAAVARGAEVIEKHFTLDRNLPGPDHQASLEPMELKQMVQGIREVEMAMGNARKVPALEEVKNMAVARKSLVALKPIRKNEKFTTENLGCKRPGTGISPIYYWDYLGKPAEKDFQKDEVIQ